MCCLLICTLHACYTLRTFDVKSIFGDEHTNQAWLKLWWSANWELHFLFPPYLSHNFHVMASEANFDLSSEHMACIYITWKCIVSQIQNVFKWKVDSTTWYLSLSGYTNYIEWHMIGHCSSASITKAPVVVFILLKLTNTMHILFTRSIQRLSQWWYIA